LLPSGPLATGVSADGYEEYLVLRIASAEDRAGWPALSGDQVAGRG
jgi:transposase-like protein